VVPKPEQARHAFIFGTVLAIAMIFRSDHASAVPQSPSAESIQPCQVIYQSQYLNLY
jgi:hypothetical protein